MNTIMSLFRKQRPHGFKCVFSHSLIYFYIENIVVLWYNYYNNVIKTELISNLCNICKNKGEK